MAVSPILKSLRIIQTDEGSKTKKRSQCNQGKTLRFRRWRDERGDANNPNRLVRADLSKRISAARTGIIMHTGSCHHL